MQLDAFFKKVNTRAFSLIGSHHSVLSKFRYGSGSSRDWAAKGPFLQRVKFVVAESYERIHRSNLVGMGILPLQFKNGENADSLGLTGKERFSCDITSAVQSVKQDVVIRVHEESGSTRECLVMSRLDTEPELAYFHHGGILPYVLRKLARNNNVQASKF